MVSIRDCNPGLLFQIPEFGIEDFVIPGYIPPRSRREYGIYRYRSTAYCAKEQLLLHYNIIYTYIILYWNIIHDDLLEPFR